MSWKRSNGLNLCCSRVLERQSARAGHVVRKPPNRERCNHRSQHHGNQQRNHRKLCRSWSRSDRGRSTSQNSRRSSHNVREQCNQEATTLDQTLVNLHESRPARDPRLQAAEEAASRYRTNPLVQTPLAASNPSQLLPNHRQRILRDRIERRHRLRVGLERPLRHNQVRELG